MGDLSPVAFDIETSGLDPSAIITVAGVTMDMGSWIGLNTTGRLADSTRLTTAVEHESGSNIRLAVYQSEEDLLIGLSEFATNHIDDDRHYLTAYNGETWNSGFDLPFLRSACVRQDVEWPFPSVAYADVMSIVNRFDTGDHNDLVGVYDTLIGGDDCDPFDDSASAVDSHENGEWVPLLLHNLADIERTRELAVLAGRYVPKSDFRMKNLSPPDT
ncbi:hypothetical protein C440_02483 [Haloferax mucosum ATCC BAA-1512]|uniref:Uncharacterized protein n=1 Tax=Haloferax mucosum ATCC BAA-1512 TaxID=662479 RepID=M0IQI4_9EURY|nr:hypothetical protein [Haloferax mucosum]ELZ98078.1 hypothetical protein C440_02483 [Haloferax mucosum ATCC BAA-1512]